MENIYTKERVSKEKIQEIFIKLGVTSIFDISDMRHEDVVELFGQLGGGDLGVDDRGEYFILKQQNIMLEDKPLTIDWEEFDRLDLMNDLINLSEMLMKESERGIERYEENAE